MVPASKEPSITQSAPAAIALGYHRYTDSTISDTGTPLPLMATAASEQQKLRKTYTATIRVVQIEPGPIPTFTRLLHFQLKFSGLRVAILPTITSICGNLLNLFNTLTTPCVCP
jgi:hypothetical protein